MFLLSLQVIQGLCLEVTVWQRNAWNNSWRYNCKYIYNKRSFLTHNFSKAGFGFISLCVRPTKTLLAKKKKGTEPLAAVQWHFVVSLRQVKSSDYHCLQDIRRRNYRYLTHCKPVTSLIKKLDEIGLINRSMNIPRCWGMVARMGKSSISSWLG